MARFRCFFISDADIVDGFKSFEGATEREALNRAYEMLESHSQAAAVEVWETGRFVTRIPRRAENNAYERQ